jgi:hypothetical protein
MSTIRYFSRLSQVSNQIVFSIYFNLPTTNINRVRIYRKLGRLFYGQKLNMTTRNPDWVIYQLFVDERRQNEYDKDGYERLCIKNLRHIADFSKVKPVKIIL